MGDQRIAHPELITTYGETSPFSEAYRVLRVNLFQRNGNGHSKPIWSLGITGARPQHGSSTVAANLGLIMIETGSRVIVVDADFYKPSLHRLFGISNDIGLSSVLQGQADVDRALQTVTDPPLLRVLPTGPKVKNPSAVLQPKALTAFLDRLRGLADYVLVDLPSVSAVAYTSSLASLMDGLVLVVRAGTTVVGVERMLKRRLQGVNIVGMVLNRVPVEGSELSSYRHYFAEKS